MGGSAQCIKKIQNGPLIVTAAEGCLLDAVRFGYQIQRYRQGCQEGWRLARFSASEIVQKAAKGIVSLVIDHQGLMSRHLRFRRFWNGRAR